MKAMENFACNLFNDTVMKERLPQSTYQALQRCKQDNVTLSDSDAGIFAEALCKWAMEKGATHYTHWFQPLTGITAEKHESFLSPNQQGNIITKFRAKELIKGEPDASSFPNGGIRATFEARGYTAWDPTSYAFIKEKTLCIPTVFCSYSGELLDKKTPLLKSNNLLSKHALRILKLFGSDATSVSCTVGAEQEYFLIDKSVYHRRKDLVYCGRTLFGANPPKGQQLDDHYFGSIKPRVAKYMEELDEELAKVGIISKTEHNEVAPAQHELAPSYTNGNIACDQNQLTMELMKRIADKHDMACLLHEKPFAGINGSGKHNNWSMLTNTDVNLLEPGSSPQQNAQFLLFLTAIIKGVDDYQQLLRAAVATAGNDHRLGSSEAPPAIISIFVGSDLEAVIGDIINHTKTTAKGVSKMHIGVDSLPLIPQDSTDRNRTSPLAFTGNKFEFRMPGSSQSIADTITTINTIVADSLCQFADILENAVDFDSQLNQLIEDNLKAHSRIIFNGDGYSSQWKATAKSRGLADLASTVDTLTVHTSPRNMQLFVKHGILTEREIIARQSILSANYSKTIHIEAQTMLNMTNKDILPSVHNYIGQVASIAHNLQSIGNDITVEQTILNKTTALMTQLLADRDTLVQQLQDVPVQLIPQAQYYHDKVLATMQSMRVAIDTLEAIVPRQLWTLPSYGDILYSVN